MKIHPIKKTTTKEDKLRELYFDGSFTLLQLIFNLRCDKKPKTKYFPGNFVSFSLSFHKPNLACGNISPSSPLRNFAIFGRKAVKEEGQLSM